MTLLTTLHPRIREAMLRTTETVPSCNALAKGKRLYAGHDMFDMSCVTAIIVDLGISVLLDVLLRQLRARI